MDMYLGLTAGVCVLMGYGIGAYATYHMFKKRAQKKDMWYDLMNDKYTDED